MRRKKVEDNKIVSKLAEKLKRAQEKLLREAVCESIGRTVNHMEGSSVRVDKDPWDPKYTESIAKNWCIFWPTKENWYPSFYLRTKPDEMYVRIVICFNPWKWVPDLDGKSGRLMLKSDKKAFAVCLSGNDDFLIHSSNMESTLSDCVGLIRSLMKRPYLNHTELINEGLFRIL